MKKIFLFCLILLSIVLIFKAFFPTEKIQLGKVGEKTEENKIKKFSSVSDLQAFLEENQNQAEGYGGGMGKAEIMMEDRAASAPSLNMTKEAPPETAGMGPDYSKTNVQIEGVDEADIVKTDGKNIYAVSGNNLFIVNAYPAENSKILAKIEFKSTPQEIYINGNYLIVYGYNNLVYDKSWFKKFKRQSPYTFFKVFNVADAKNPRQVRDLDFEGNIVSSRMIGDYVYLVTNYYAGGILDPVPYPRIMESGKLLNEKSAPEIFYFDMPYDGFNFVAVSAINVKNNNAAPNMAAYLLPASQNIFVSQNNLYLTYTKYVSEEELAADVLKEILWPKLSEREKERIAEIEKTKNYILGKSEKLQKINNLLQVCMMSLPQVEQDKLLDEVERVMKKKYEDLSKELEKTVIHKIAINKNSLDYQGYGEVTGTVLNQFSMDENNGYFRIATTKNRTWSRLEENLGNRESYNNLYILDQKMKTVGSLEDLANGERIYSVRFMQGRAYMVTFRQTDPLFVIDLKNPKNPRVLGKLKVPGFSQYLHPYDENTLIGFGKETDDQGVIQSLKLSLFDVSDVDNLREIDKVTMGERGSNSVALYDHKAFLFSKDKELLVVPVEIREEGRDDVVTMNEPAPCVGGNCFDPSPPRYQYFRGAIVYEISKNGFKLKGKIDHADNAEISTKDWYGYRSYETNVKRSLYIDDILYTMSDKYVKMNKISDLDEVKSLKLQFPVEKEEDFKVVN